MSKLSPEAFTTILVVMFGAAGRKPLEQSLQEINAAGQPPAKSSKARSQTSLPKSDNGLDPRRS